MDIYLMIFFLSYSIFYILFLIILELKHYQNIIQLYLVGKVNVKTNVFSIIIYFILKQSISLKLQQFILY